MEFRFDVFTHKHPSLYSKKWFIVGHLKSLLFRLIGVNVQDEWHKFSLILNDVLGEHCKAKKVLDVGCGTGEFLHMLEIKYECQTFGLDISEPMVRQAVRNNPSHNYCVGSSMCLPFKHKSVDVVIFRWVFHHMHPKIWHISLREAGKLAREAIIIQDVSDVENRFLRKLLDLYWKLIDGAHVHKTTAEWMEFFREEGVNVKYFYQGGKFARTNLFVIRAS